MDSTTDPNEVRMTGENSFLQLYLEEDGPHTTRASHWRVLHSPAGAGHCLFLKSEVTADQVRIYSDNIALTRWLRDEIESFLFPEFADQGFPMVDALFSKSGDTMTYWTEMVESDEETVMLTWYDFGEPFVIRVPPGAVPGRQHGVYSCFVPGCRAQLTVDGLVAKGRPFPEQREDRTGSTACLALSETWVRPY